MASSTISLPPGRATTMSGRTARSAPSRSAPRPWTCSAKSTCEVIPAASTTRRSCTSPQEPRALVERSAEDSPWVVSRSSSCPRRAPSRASRTAPNWSARSRSISRTCCSTVASWVRTGARACSTSWSRAERASRVSTRSRSCSAVDAAPASSARSREFCSASPASDERDRPARRNPRAIPRSRASTATMMSVRGSMGSTVPAATDRSNADRAERCPLRRARGTNPRPRRPGSGREIGDRHRSPAPQPRCGSPGAGQSQPLSRARRTAS